MGKKPKRKILKVTITQHYDLEMIDKERTIINGWIIEDVIKDWFKDTNISMSHATRDGHLIGNSKEVVDVTVIDEEDMKWNMPDGTRNKPV